ACLFALNTAIPEANPGFQTINRFVSIIVRRSNDCTELCSNSCTMLIQYLLESCPGIKSHYPGQTQLPQCIARQSLTLAILITLNGVFGIAQKSVGFKQCRSRALGQIFFTLKKRQHFTNLALTQTRVSTAANQLKRLHHKFHFANAAFAKLHVQIHTL